MNKYIKILAITLIAIALTPSCKKSEIKKQAPKKTVKVKTKKLDKGYKSKVKPTARIITLPSEHRRSRPRRTSSSYRYR